MKELIRKVTFDKENKYDLSNKEKKQIYDSIIDYWNNTGNKSTARVSKGSKKNIFRLLDNFTENELTLAIQKYNDMYLDEKFFFNYKWTFTYFFTNYAIDRFLVNDSKINNMYNNYIDMKNKQPKKIEYYIDDVLVHYKEMIQHLKNMKYSDYLKTEHWTHFKKEALKFYNNRCVTCGSTKKLEVHHNNYDNRGRETFNDVVVLCDECHKKIHGIKVIEKNNSATIDDRIDPF